MPKIEWDSKTGGVLLKRHITKSTLSVSPRPVFFEELNLLHLKEKGWCYPECKEPLLWACNKVYYYRGEPVFEVKGANVYDEPTVIFFLAKLPALMLFQTMKLPALVLTVQILSLHLSSRAKVPKARFHSINPVQHQIVKLML